MSEGLKPCPFCGGEASLRNRHDYWRIECEDCPVQIAMDVAGDCVEAWNRRHIPAPDFEARVKRLEAWVFGKWTIAGGVKTVYEPGDPDKVFETVRLPEELRAREP